MHNVLEAYRVAYNTAIGDRPFELMFRLNTILRIEFLLPTLLVVQELEWIGHELSQ